MQKTRLRKACFANDLFRTNKLYSENKRADRKSYAECERQKMFQLDRFAFFQKSVKNRKNRNRRTADHRAEYCAEQRAD